MLLWDSLSSKFSVYVFFVVGWSLLGSCFRPTTGNYIEFTIWFTVYSAINLWLGDCAKNWAQMVFWFISVPDFVMLIFIGDSDLANFLEGKGQFFLLVLLYIIFWVWGALRFDKEQYKCATSCILAMLTTISGIIAYICFIPSNAIIGQLSQENVPKYVGIVLSIFFIADRWGKFFLDLRDMREKENAEGAA